MVDIHSAFSQLKKTTTTAQNLFNITGEKGHLTSTIDRNLINSGNLNVSQSTNNISHKTVSGCSKPLQANPNHRNNRVKENIKFD